MNMNSNIETPKQDVIVDVEGFQDSMYGIQKKLDEVQAKYDLIKDDPSYEEDAARLKSEIFDLTERLISTKN